MEKEDAAVQRGKRGNIMAKLYLIRHGETDYNNSLRFQGQTDIPLNQKGIEQAEKAADFFRNIPLQAIYTSTLIRGKRNGTAGNRRVAGNELRYLGKHEH